MPEPALALDGVEVRDGSVPARRARNGGDPLASAYELFPMLREARRRSAGALSGGQQQQLAIGRALVADPDVLLLDEPSLGLAPTAVDGVFAALAAIRDRGVTILLVEQRAQRTVALADRTHVLVGGLLRLVNFASGQLVMAGAYTPAFTSGWPVAASVAACFVVVVALSLAMDRVVFRPLRGASPAVMLVTTFAIAFLLQAVALIVDLRDNQLGEVALSLAPLNRAITVGGVEIRKITIVAVVIAAVALGLLALLLARTTIGLHTRAAAADFRTARLLGVRANRVIAFAVVVSGLLAAAVAVMMTVQFPLVSPDFALRDTIVVLVGVVVGGIDRLWTATLGGFTNRFRSGRVNGGLPTGKTGGLPAAVFPLLLLVLLLRPAGLFAWGRRAA